MVLNRGNLIELTSLDRDVRSLPNQLELEQQVHTVQTVQMVQEDHPIRYDRFELLVIKDKVKQDSRLKILLLDACKIIRRLKLNRRGTRGGIKNWKKWNRSNKLPRGIGHGNLIKINFYLNHALHQLNSENFVVSLANVQSKRRKDSILYRYLHSIKCDISVVTETWLRDDEADDAWLQSSDLCISEYDLFKSNQKDRPGGGLEVIVHKDC